MIMTFAGTGRALIVALAIALFLSPRPVHGAPELVPKMAPGFKPSGASDEAGLWMSVDNVEKEVKRSRFVVTDDVLNEYVRGITCRLAGEYCSDIRIYIIRVPYFNASMYPNGMMHVWTGLLLRVQNEAQLAAVLGHEIGHYLRRHSIERWRDIRRKSGFGAFLRLGLAAAGAGAGADVADLVLIASIFAYGRGHEREADAFGLDLMTRAGYSPIEASRVWRGIIAEEESAEKKRRQSIFFASHPAPKERMATLKRLALEHASEETEDFRDRFVANVGVYRAMLLEDQLKLRQFNRTDFLIERLIAGGINVGELQYYKGEMYRLRNTEGDRSLAREAYLSALDNPGIPPEIYRSIGYLDLKDGRPEQAAVAFARYLELQPDADDREMIKFYLMSGEQQ